MMAMDEKIQNDLEEQLREYTRIVNDPKSTRADIERLDAVLQNTLGIQDNVISQFEESKDANVKYQFQAIEKQLEDVKMAFEQKLEEVEKQAQSESKEREGKELAENSAATQIAEEEKDKPQNIEEITDTEDDSDNQEETKELESEIDDLDERAEKLEKEMELMYEAKAKQLTKSVESGAMLQERKEYEQKQDAMNQMIANYVIEKTILTERRQAYSIELGRQIDLYQKGMPVGMEIQKYQDEIASITREIEGKDATFWEQHKIMQDEVKAARVSLEQAVYTKNNEPARIVKKSSNALSDRFEEKMKYSNEGELKAKYVRMWKNSQKIETLTQYSNDVIANGLENSMSECRIAAGGYTVRVVSNAYSKGVDTAFYMGNQEMANNDIGAEGTTAKTYSADSLVKEEPDLTDALNKAGIDTGGDFQNTIDSVEEAQEAIEEERNNAPEQEEDYEIPYNGENYPNGTRYDS